MIYFCWGGGDYEKNLYGMYSNIVRDIRIGRNRNIFCFFKVRNIDRCLQ